MSLQRGTSRVRTGKLLKPRIYGPHRGPAAVLYPPRNDITHTATSIKPNRKTTEPSNIHIPARTRTSTADVDKPAADPGETTQAGEQGGGDNTHVAHDPKILRRVLCRRWSVVPRDE